MPTLCLTCGLCCDGTIFRDVQFQRGDLRAKAAAAAFGTLGGAVRSKLPQPCALLDGCRCRIYEDRPRHCRDFECLLLQNVQEGRITPSAASNTIRCARDLADRIRDCLERLGNRDTCRPLSERFQTISRRANGGGLDEDAAAAYADLTVAVHDLNCLLADSFYR